MARHPRNRQLVPGVNRFSRCQASRHRYTWKYTKAVTKTTTTTTATATAKRVARVAKTVKVNGDKNGSERHIAIQKAPRFYPAEDVKRPVRAHKAMRPTKLRSSITPGTVLILLAGRFRGKRVVFLKQLSSGLLLVTGPYKVNGVPLRRVNQAYVIATSTKIDLCDVTIDKKFNDTYFKREKAEKKKGTEEEFFGEEAKKPVLPEGRAADQKAVDAAIVSILNKDPMLRSYLAAKFSLSKGQAPHALKF